MYQTPERRGNQTYRRPAGQDDRAWAARPNAGMDPSFAQDAPYPGPDAYDAPAPEEDPGYREDEEPIGRGLPFREEPVEEVIATNRTVCLTCTLSAMMGLFALFLCFAEKRSRAIRHFSVQSAGLSFCHVMAGAALLLVGSLLGMIPILGFLIRLVCWLAYIAILMVTVFLRVKMMMAAWHGVKFVLPVVGHRLEHFC